ncbi:DUF2310 family Zn-ribbon-containing protein [Hahella aquimaris]|uniref:DUF2310 family Zn-ribbon-containing protein n=1 Tax=Hahella sp. HNIBRBA332 TaxID=3015983 RepID=UPI00273AFFF3|nr:DUF2310 family Zn-ribbon-containing protein [Hahella sp. HNIBRBA332]WLQ13396.1 DUF2310 family Zn-ribbon-containing protein [Hahella sp. HNIBRBA332]
MILHKVTFGSLVNDDKDEALELAFNFLSTLAHNGQVNVDDYVCAVQQGLVCAYVNTLGPSATELRFYNRYGLSSLEGLKRYFGGEPVWEKLEDNAAKKEASWKGAPFLYLHTLDNGGESPLYRGDNGENISLYTVPCDADEREQAYFWQRDYRQCDSIWMRSAVLESETYKELADANSALTLAGKEVSRIIEAATGVPTYYFLFRYWGRRKNEEKRRCPGCGGDWRTGHSIERSSDLWLFPYQCEPCRLVASHALADDDERRASIGEWKDGK